MTDKTPKINLPYILASQTMKHVTLNEVLNIIDKLINCCVKSRLVTSQPANPNDGDCYIVPIGAIGNEWQNYPVGAIAAYYNLGWTYFLPSEGLSAWLEDQDMSVVFANGNWIPVSGQLNRSLNYLSENGVLVRAANGNAETRNIEVGTGLKISNFNGANGNPKIEIDETAKITNSSSINSYHFDSKHQVASVNWLGDIDNAKWSTKLGGYKLSFASDSEVFTGALGGDTFDYEGRTYRVKLRIDTIGRIDALSGYLVNNNLVIDASGHQRLVNYSTNTLPSASTAGQVIGLTNGQNNKPIAISDGVNWRYADGDLV